MNSEMSNDDEGLKEQDGADTKRKPYPEGAVFRNGVPLFPVEGRTQVVTPERVKQLMDEED